MVEWKAKPWVYIDEVKDFEAEAVEYHRQQDEQAHLDVIAAAEREEQSQAEERQRELDEQAIEAVNEAERAVEEVEAMVRRANKSQQMVVS